MPKQILIVDDDRELSRMLHATLELFDRSFKSRRARSITLFVVGYAAIWMTAKGIRL